MTRKKNLPPSLTAQQQIFCCEYIIDWNGTRARKVAYPKTKNDNVAAVEAHNLLRKPKIKAYIDKMKNEIETQAGISKLLQINELKPLATSSITDTNTDWFVLKDFKNVSESAKKAIKEIKTETVYTSEGERKETVHLKFHDKRAAIETINKMMAYNKEKDGDDSPQELNITFGKD